mgnify:CR=1
AGLISVGITGIYPKKNSIIIPIWGFYEIQLERPSSRYFVYGCCSRSVGSDP